MMMMMMMAMMMMRGLRPAPTATMTMMMMMMMMMTMTTTTATTKTTTTTASSPPPSINLNDNDDINTSNITENNIFIDNENRVVSLWPSLMLLSSFFWPLRQPRPRPLIYLPRTTPSRPHNICFLSF